VIQVTYLQGVFKPLRADWCTPSNFSSFHFESKVNIDIDLQLAEVQQQI